eukprot:TRINITY_DN1091_c0_g1_i4.p2 TRINITY_DN1091_c0_g1~~TRINITY_DN1091_c0_g1_i4.p2  ORF type:complete len:109 (+),score=40.34 TRINITY_DN1091_c0_g1_i4:232-558(+)
MKAVTFLLLLVVFISVASAHHSLRTRKPKTEAERIEHHLLHRRQPRKSIVNDFSNKEPNTNHIRKSPSYHFKVGPEYPHHNEHTNIPYKETERKDKHGRPLVGSAMHY